MKAGKVFGLILAVLIIKPIASLCLFLAEAIRKQGLVKLVRMGAISPLQAVNLHLLVDSVLVMPFYRFFEGLGGENQCNK